MLCLVTFTAAFLYQSTILNPMLYEIYTLEPEKSSLFFTLSAVAFVVTTPVAFQLRSRKIARRRPIMYFALLLMASAMIMRTGDLKGEAHIVWVYIGQFLNGAGLALLTTTTLPEIVDSVERTELYPRYDKDSVNIYISGMFILLSSIGQALGTFFGSTAADAIGYTWSFIAGGIFTFCFCVCYLVICGGGYEIDFKQPKQNETELPKRDSVPPTEDKPKVN